MHAGNDDGSLVDLDLVTTLLGTGNGPEAASEIKLRADLAMRSESLVEAHQFYLEAQKTLDNFVEAATEGEPVQSRYVFRDSDNDS